MESDALSDLVDSAYPSCPCDGTLLDDEGTVERPFFRCPTCGLTVIN